MKRLQKPISLLLMLCLLCGVMALAGCSGAKAKVLADCAIIHEPEFGGVYISATIDEFNALGYQYGDSVDIAFSNGYTLTDQPYYNGYYTENGESLLVAYPGYDYIKACINNGDDLWLIAGLTEDETATVTLNTRGKYLDIQNARDIHYTDAREDYDSDEIFANFRAVSVTGLKENTLYRSASPCDNQHNRAVFVNDLIEAAGVQCILNLADNDEKIAGYLADESFDTPCFRALYEAGNVIPIALNMNFASADFQQKLTSGLVALSEHEGPYLVHCTEGKDRTGFVCLLLEAFCGASYEEIVADYMITYDNYYGITKETDAARYDVIVEHVLNPMIQVVAGEGADVTTADLRAGAEAFLRSAGMTDKQITALEARLVSA
ncbi:MAG: tyrosine-protein phosphatase [Oscillospiraceae bacterium]|nr:tyrosine-protein phosphatase [Oscillospiraceae bacterium]